MKRVRLMLTGVVGATGIAIAMLVAWYVPPSEARADDPITDIYNIPAETCVQRSGNAVTRNSDGISSSDSFSLRCPIDFPSDAAELTNLSGWSSGCGTMGGGGGLTFSVRRRNNVVDASATNIATCVPAWNAVTCSDGLISHNVSDNYYYWVEFNYTGGLGACEVAGAQIAYIWDDHT